MQVLNATALVTGATRGIGRTLVQALVSVGAKKIYVGARESPNSMGHLIANVLASCH
jgi:NAD(P)-dependent dehydrogenase (short-subunit alcohol dehydrogenase family)